MKNTHLLNLTIFLSSLGTLPACATRSSDSVAIVKTDFPSPSSENRTPSIRTSSFSYTKQIIDRESNLITPDKTWENDVFLIGWKSSNQLGYDITNLSKEEREKIIDKGLKTLIDDADKKDHEKINRTLLAHYYFSQKDFKKSTYWASKGAESGSASCMRILSAAYMEGTQGLAQNFEEGIKWAYLGAAAGDKRCKAFLSENSARLFIHDFASILLNAQQKATAWTNDHSELFMSPNS